MKTIVIIPAYNEGHNIRNLVESIRKLYPEYDILVIDDGSTDKTASEAALAGAMVISHICNMGYGVAIQTGYKYAFRHSYKYLVQLDGDGQHDPEGIGLLLEALHNSNADIVLGSRFLGLSTYKPSFLRMTGIRFFRILISLLSNAKITDPTTGFQAMNRRVLSLFVQDIFPSDYPDADIIILLANLGFKILEIPVKMYPNKQGRSMHKNPLNAIYYVFKMTMAMFITTIRDYSYHKQNISKQEVGL